MTFLKNKDSNMAFVCDICNKSFTRKSNLTQHTQIHIKDSKKFNCDTCGIACTRKNDLLNHIKTRHGEKPEFVCSSCGKAFAKAHNRNHHARFNCSSLRDARLVGYHSDSPSNSVDGGDVQMEQTTPGPSSTEALETRQPQTTSAQQTTGEFGLKETGFQNRLKTYSLRRPPSRAVTIHHFFVFVFEHVIELLKTALKEFPSIKVNLFLECEFTNIKGDRCVRNFKTKNVPLTLLSDLSQFCSDVFDKILHEKDQCQLVGSGWSFLRILNFEVRINKYNPLKGTSHIPLPKNLSKIGGLINVLNNDNLCFMYAILAKFIKTEPQRPSSYTHATRGKYDWAGVKFPMALKDIPAFEKRNNISVNIYGLDFTVVGQKQDGKPIFQHTVFPLKICDSELDDHRDLLYIKNENTSHYVYISDFNKLVRKQLTKHDGSIHICKKCFAYFDNQPNKLNLSGAARLTEHKKYCNSDNPVRMDLSPETTISFNHHERSQRARFCVYADFECALHPISNPTPTPDQSFTVPTQLHVPYSYCYHVKDTQGEFNVTRLYRGDDAARHFMDSIKVDVLHIGDILYNNRQMTPILTPEEQVTFDAATTCYLCGKGFTPDDAKVRDHSHAAPFSYRGPAHRSCNVRYQEQNTVNCYFHNLSNYDAHFIVRELDIDQGDIKVLADSEEKYISFEKRFPYEDARRGNMKLRFLDTFRFMSSSLAKLVDNLPKDLLRETRKQFPLQNQFDLVNQKGVFPYSHITSAEVLTETQLPPIEAFYNDLTLEHIDEHEYAHAQNVWSTFGIQHLGQYSDLYLLTDVLLLADVFENFRDMCMKEYKLDPAHYFTLPSYAWDVMLKMTDVTLDTLQDFDMYLFFERGIRGGITQCCTRYAQANNKYTEGYDSTKPSEYIMYFDANNLYGFSMSQNLPTGGFQWLSPLEIENLDIPNLAADGNTGYVFEVDLSYPVSKHRDHESLPFCCESSTPPNGKFPKLLTTLTDKKNYIIHYRTLQQAIENGLSISKIHRVLSFNQSRWLKSYIDLNTSLRKSASNEFEKDLFKLMNNAVFGRSMMNVRKFVDIRLVSDGVKFEKLVARSNFKDRTFFKPDLASIHLEKTRIVLDKPIYVGMCILELSKWLMYDFHYNTMLRRYGNRIKLLYTDTDSLVYLIRSDDFFKDMEAHLGDFDTSEYPKEHPCYRTTNAKTLGKFKDEVKGCIIIEFIGLLAKLYCIIIQGNNGSSSNKVIKRAKGISKGVVKNELTAEDYRNCLFEHREKFTLNKRFVSNKHVVTTVTSNKLSLSPTDDKRYLLPDGVNTLPWGHCDVPLQ